MIDHHLLKKHDYALVAAESLNDLPADIPAQRLTCQHFENSDSLLPSFVDLKSLSEKQSTALLVKMQNQIEQGGIPVGNLLLKTSYTPAQIKAYFARNQVCIHQNGGESETAWLRLHDPRVWVHLQRVLGEHHFVQLVYKIPEWTLYFSNEWINNTFEHTSQGNQTAHGYISVDATQWADLQRIGLVNRSLRHLNIESHADTLRKSPELNAQICYAQKTYGLQRIDDIVRYVALAQQIHLRFDQHPLMKEAHQRYQKLASQSKIDEDESVVDAFNEIPSSQWPVIRAELNQTQPIAA